MRVYQDLIRNWVPRRYRVLGTDGFGRSDTRAALGDFFEVDELLRRSGYGDESRRRRINPAREAG